MSVSRIVTDLDSHLKSEERKRQALRDLLLSKKISGNTFDLMEKRIDHVALKTSDLKDAIEQEEAFWKETLSKESRIFESLLIELEHRRLMGTIGDEEWRRKSKIIGMGLDSLQNITTSTDIMRQQPAPPFQTNHESSMGRKIEKPETAGPPAPREVRPQKRVMKEPPKPVSSSASGLRCMNPWKPGCKSTDIGLSIYYNGRMVPICRRCWEDISNKNVEWSSL